MSQRRKKGEKKKPFVSNAVPLLDTTYHFCEKNTRAFLKNFQKKMRKDAFSVNHTKMMEKSRQTDEQA